MIVADSGPILEAMLGSGYWIDEELIPPFLQEIGEVDT